MALLTSTFSAQMVELEDNEISNQNPFSFTHTVFTEEATGTWCGYCPAVITILDNIWNSGLYDWYYVALVEDKNTYANQRCGELGVTGYPTCFYDGGYTKIVGGGASQQDHENKIIQCGSRNVKDIDLTVAGAWMGSGQIQVSATITNNEASTYNGHIHVYVTEEHSRWYNGGTQYHFAFLGNYGLNENVVIPAGDSLSLSETWTGPSDITINNIKIIGSVFSLSNMYTDETDGADPDPPNSNPPNTPSQPSGVNSGAINIEYTYTTSATEINGDNIQYGWDWDGDDTVDEWTEFYPSGDQASGTHAWETTGTYDVQVKAKDIFGDESSFSSARSVQITLGDPPETPSTPSGETSGLHSKTYSYSTSTTDSDIGDQLYYFFDWGDGSDSGWVGPSSSGDTISASHKWNDLGDYEIKVKAKDLAESETSWSDSLFVTMGNTAPETPQKPEGPSSGIIGLEYRFTTVTDDPEGDELEYLFEWGDGTDSGWISTPYAEKKWFEAGEYGIAVKARDSWDESELSSYKTITIEEGSLTVSVNANPTVAIVGEEISFSATAIDGTAPYTWSYDFGDGNTSEEQNPTHIYQQTGVFTISISVFDDVGAYGSDFTTVTIDLTHPPEIPTITGITDCITYQPCEFTVSGTDPDGDDVYLMVDWGDGDTSEWEGPFASGEETTFTHAWTSDGQYPVKVKARDEFEYESGWSSSLDVTVDWQQAFLLGQISGKTENDETIEFTAENVFLISTSPLSFQKIPAGQTVITVKNGGFMSEGFIFGKFLIGYI